MDRFKFDHQISVDKIYPSYQCLNGYEGVLDAAPCAYVHRVGDKEAKNVPVVVVLPPWLNSADSLVGWRAFKESMPSRCERLYGEGKIPNCLFVYPRLYTKFGGSQFIDSKCFGPHAKWVVTELFNYLENKYSIATDPTKRITMGRSSGGFASLRFSMDYPGFFGKVLCHSGDMGFETMLKRDMVFICDFLFKYNFNVREFLKASIEFKKFSGRDLHAMMLIGYAGFYGDFSHPDDIQLPVNYKTAEIKTDEWQKWLEHDPVVRIEKKHPRADYLYLDCGTKDQYYLHYGLRQFKNKADKVGCNIEVHEFPDNHSGTEYRFDISLQSAFNR